MYLVVTYCLLFIYHFVCVVAEESDGSYLAAILFRCAPARVKSVLVFFANMEVV